MEREWVLSEIKRTAALNGGLPLGRRRFETLTGIRPPDWEGKLWARWGDALKEAGFRPNEPKKAYSREFLSERLAHLIRELGHIPTRNELKMKDRSDPSFPSANPFERLGHGRKQLAASMLSFCSAHAGFEDVAGICGSLGLPESAPSPTELQITRDQTPWGFVYLGRSGRYYKIGRSNSVGRRTYELDIQLPEKLRPIHKIQTDDPEGIERYWHRRFETKRKNGEWFDLSAEDVSAFRRRKFM